MKVTVLGGATYPGVVSSIGLASLGHKVLCADRNARAIASLELGLVPTREPETGERLSRAMVKGTIRFTTDCAGACRDASVIVVAAGGHGIADEGSDLAALLESSGDIAEGLGSMSDPGRKVVVAITATVPVGTCELFRDRLYALMESGHEGVDIVSNPGFLREGSAFHDFLKPDRIVVGAYRRSSVALMRRLYSRIDAPMVATDPRSAEMIKYASNAYLATRISFINEIASICESVGADVRRVVSGMGLDRRIGRQYLSPGSGFGGPNLSGDLKALISMAAGSGQEPVVLEAVLERNESRIESMVSDISSMLGGLREKTIALFGMGFKTGVDSVANSPALSLAARLEAEGARIRMWDRILSDSESARGKFGSLSRRRSDAVLGADCVVLMTDDEEFRKLKWRNIHDLMRTRIIYDTKRTLDAKKAIRCGFAYIAFGVAKRRLPWWFRNRTEASSDD